MNQVEQRKARRLVLLRDGDHESKVRLYERALGLFTSATSFAVFPPFGGGERFAVVISATVEVDAHLVAQLDCLRKPDCVVLGEQRVLTDVRQIQTNEIFLVPLDPFLS